MSISLYDDQQSDVEAVRKLLRFNRSVVLQMPTGSGKTVVAGYIAQRAREKGRKILILVHRRELVGQFLKTLQGAGLADDVGIVCPGYASTPWSPIQLAMVMSWCRRKPHFEPNLIFVDEAHHVRAKSWDDVLSMYPKARVVGMTATPVRLDGKGLSPPFESIHCGRSIPELIELKRLSPIRVLRVPVGFGAKGLKKTGGDYNKKQLDERADAKVVGHSAMAYGRYLQGRRTIMFGVTKRHARATADALKADGVRAVAIGDDTPKDVRENSLRMFSEGRIDVVCNVSLIDEGFDVPACDAVMDVAHTASLTRYLQRVGRALRYEPGKKALLLDLVGNTYRHGLPDIDRTWTLDEGDGETKQERAKAGNKLRCCKSCLTLFSPRLIDCPHCGAEHDGRPVSEVDVELVEANGPPPKPKKEPKMDKRRRANLMKEVRIMIRRGKGKDAWMMLKAAAKENGYHHNWAHITADLVGLPHYQRGNK